MKKIAALILLVAFAFTACSAPVETTSTPKATSIPMQPEEPTSSPTPEPTLEPSPEPVPVSPTTGLPGNTEYMPVLVMIENSTDARPQSGMQSADVVYEAVVEGATTRFLTVFNDTLPDYVGPVRSARVYYLNILREWDGLFVHYGGPGSGTGDASIYSSENSGFIQQRLDGISGSSNDYFFRISEKSSPHNAYTDVAKDATIYNYEPEQNINFKFEEGVVYEGAQMVSRVDLSFMSSDETFVNYRYNGETFERYMGDEPFTDNETQSVITMSNVIVQHVDYSMFPNDSAGRRNIELTGSGIADFFIGGQHVAGTWERESLEDVTVFKAQDGSEIILKPGNTWFAIHPDSGQINVTYQ